jgi:glycosyltransferase involved in cell wall biosynthesis
MPINVLFLHGGGGGDWDRWMRGSENALLSLLVGLDRRKIVPYLYSGNSVLAELADAKGVETALYPIAALMIDGPEVHLQFLSWAQTLRRLLSLIKKKNIQLVYCNAGSPCQVGYYAAKISGIPVICHLHAPYHRRYILLYRFHRASTVIFVSKAIEKKMCEKQHFRARCELVYNGIDPDRFRPAKERDGLWRERLGFPPDAVVFGQVSSLIRRKGVDVLLRAFQSVNRRYPECRLVLVGDGPQREDYVTLAAQLGVADKVYWAGDQPEPLPFYQHVFDVNVLASRSEAFGLSLLEAAACELPSLGANVEGIPEAIIDRQTGFLFNCEDHEELADKMSALICARDLRKRLGKAGRELVLERFSERAYVERIQRVITETASVSGAQAHEKTGICSGSYAN